MSRTSTSNIERPPTGVYNDEARTPKIGPNAVIQLVESVRAAGLEGTVAPAFSRVGATAWLTTPPDAMTDAAQVGRLHQAIRASLPPAQADALLADAGGRTADYLLSARIPRPVQLPLKLLPAQLSATILVSAIRAHAWTFAGGGQFRALAGSPMKFEISGNPLCAGEQSLRPVCAWHAAVFRRLFQVLVSQATTVIETSCEACGDNCCRFVLGWRATGGGA